MNLLAGKLYDPAASVSKATTAALAMTALDTTNLRLAFTVPPSGNVRVRLGGVLHGATTYPQILLGVLEGATVRGRQAPMSGGGNLAATSLQRVEADFIVTGLTPGAAVNWDAAYGVETLVAATGLKYGGANNTTANDAFGGFVFEIWDPCPIYTPASGAAPTTTESSRIDTILAAVDTEVASILAAVDTEVAAIKAKTDQLTFTIANKLDASIQAAADFAQGAADKVWGTAARVLTAGTNIVLAKGVGVTGFNDIAAADVWAVATRRLSDGANIVLAKGVGVTGFTDLDASGVRGAVGLGAANLDTQLSAISTKTAALPPDPADASDIAAAFSVVNGNVLTRAAPGDAMTLTGGERTTIADVLLDRDLSIGADTGSAVVRTVRQALRALRNKWGFPAGVYTVYKEDDVTASWTGAITTDAAALPVIGVDP